MSFSLLFRSVFSPLADSIELKSTVNLRLSEMTRMHVSASTSFPMKITFLSKALSLVPVVNSSSVKSQSERQIVTESSVLNAIKTKAIDSSDTINNIFTNSSSLIETSKSADNVQIIRSEYPRAGVSILSTRTMTLPSVSADRPDFLQTSFTPVTSVYTTVFTNTDNMVSYTLLPWLLETPIYESITANNTFMYNIFPSSSIKYDRHRTNNIISMFTNTYMRRSQLTSSKCSHSSHKSLDTHAVTRTSVSEILNTDSTLLSTLTDSKYSNRFVEDHCLPFYFEYRRL